MSREILLENFGDITRGYGADNIFNVLLNSGIEKSGFK